MKLLTRYTSGDTGTGGSGLARLLARDTASTPAPKRAPLLIRLPYYIFLVALVAIYYGYVVSLNIRWLVIQEGRPGLSFIFLAIFHVLFGLFMWCLLATVYRGPGAVGETLTHDTRQDYGDIEAGGRTSEVQPLMQEDVASGASSNPAIGTQATATAEGRPPRWRRRGSSRSHSSAEGEEERQEQDYLKLQPKLDLDDGDSSDEDEVSTSSGRRKPIEIVYSGALGASSLTAKANGKARYCRKCNVAKPDRAHHCSTCGFCVLKMDHHCPWIGGCVGFKNYKTFILFLFYGDLLAMFVCATSLWAVIQVLDTDLESLGLAPVGWGFLVLFGFLFAIMLIGFFPYHLYLSINNRSTIENMERNGRLLSLPTRAESMLAAGVPVPEIASLPERPKPGAGQHLLPMHMDGNVPQPGFAEFPSSSSRGSSNPFLPAQSSNTLGSAASYMQATLEGSRQSRGAYANNTLDRKSRRELERKSGRINIYDLGSASANFREAFGADWTAPLAWLPIGKSAGSGYEWPVNKTNFDRLQRINEQLRGAPQGV